MRPLQRAKRIPADVATADPPPSMLTDVNASSAESERANTLSDGLGRLLDEFLVQQLAEHIEDVLRFAGVEEEAERCVRAMRLLMQRKK